MIMRTAKQFSYNIHKRVRRILAAHMGRRFVPFTVRQERWGVPGSGSLMNPETGNFYLSGEDPRFYKRGIGQYPARLSGGFQSPTEINAPRGCAGIRFGRCQLTLTRIPRQFSRARIESGSSRNSASQMKICRMFAQNMIE